MNVEKKIKRMRNFMDYTAGADNLGNDEYNERRRNATAQAIKFSQNQFYRKAFKEGDYEGRTLLNSAISKGFVLLPKILLDYLDADPTSNRDPAGRTSMHYVCEVGNRSLLEEFITFKRYGIEYNAVDHIGLIPLHLAILNGHATIAEMMLESVAVVENRDLFFGRSIHAAAYMGQLPVIQRICEKFPEEVSIVTTGFCSPHVCAIYGDSTACLEFLWVRSHVMPGKILSKAVAYTNSEDTALERVKFLLGNGVDANGFDEDLCEEPAAIVAAKKGWTQVLDVLVPETTPIPDIDWSVQGVMAYVETDYFKQMDEERTVNKVERLKDRMIEELGKNNVLAAMIICDSMKTDLTEIRYTRFDSLCKFFWELGKLSINPVEVKADVIRAYAKMLNDDGLNELALLGTLGSLTFNP